MQLDPPAPGPLAAATRRLIEAFDPAAVILFGSQARGRAVGTSDYDLAVLFERPGPDAARTREIGAELESDLEKDVDLVVLNDASPIVAMQVLKEGRLLDCRDREALETFTVRTLGSYFDLKATRAPIERRLMEIRHR
jgi:uncharacterized protein